MNQNTTQKISKPNWKKDADVLKSVSLIGQLGLVMAISVIICVVLGLWLDKIFSLNGIMVAVFSFLGVIVGGLTDYKILRKFL